MIDDLGSVRALNSEALLFPILVNVDTNKKELHVYPLNEKHKVDLCLSPSYRHHTFFCVTGPKMTGGS